MPAARVVPVALGAPSLFPACLPPLGADPRAPCLSPLPRAPERLQKPPAADLASFPLCFSSPSAPCAAAFQLPTECIRTILRSPHHLTTRSLSHYRRRIHVSLVSRSSARRGSQLVCTSPSPFSSGTVGPRHRHRSSPECLRHSWRSPRCLRATPTRRAATRVSHHRRHLVKCIAAPQRCSRRLSWDTLSA
jgi:hypothetical protein